MDCSTLTEKYINDLIMEYEAQEKELESRKLEIQTDLNHWDFEMRNDLDNEMADLLKNKTRLNELETENRSLKLKSHEYEKKNNELQIERETLKLREHDFEQRVKEHEETRKDFDSRLAEIELESRKLEEKRKKLLESQQEFAKEVKDFEEFVKTERKQKSPEEIQESSEDLQPEWLKLKMEEERLEGIRSELQQVKDEFMKRLITDREEIINERKELEEEWEKVKIVRKNLKNTMPELETKLKNIFDMEDKKKFNLFTKGGQAKLEKKVADLEERLLHGITEVLVNQHEGETKEIEQQWEKIKQEEDRLERIRTEMMDVKEQIVDKYAKQRDELEQERKKLEDKWRKLCKIQKQIMDKEMHISKRSKVTKIADELKIKKEQAKESEITQQGEHCEELKKSTKLDSSLRELQNELRSEWQELHNQHNKLTQIISEFSKAKEIFEQGKNIKSLIDKHKKM